jgi:NADH-quinone oxidoreductase subunit C
MNQLVPVPQHSPEQLIRATLGDAVLDYHERLGEYTVTVQRDRIVPVMTVLRDALDFQCKMLIDICGVDYPQRPERFDVVYHLLSLSQNARLRVKVTTDEVTPVPSITSIFSAAGWFERECWDLYGIIFSGHPDLRRILTDYGFEGHPLRKDFPLTGYTEVRYDNDAKRVVYEPVQLPQDFRNFDFLSPWEGMTGMQLPGDEKAVTPPAAPPAAKAGA